MLGAAKRRNTATKTANLVQHENQETDPSSKFKCGFVQRRECYLTFFLLLGFGIVFWFSPLFSQPFKTSAGTVWEKVQPNRPDGVEPWGKDNKLQDPKSLVWHKSGGTKKVEKPGLITDADTPNANADLYGSDDETSDIEPPPSKGEVLVDTGIETGETCLNTVQGATMLVDNFGRSCHRGQVSKGGCCLKGKPMNCKGCRLDVKCCPDFESCVSCCTVNEKKVGF